MGMDVYGLKPKMNTEMPKAVKDMPEGKDWIDAFNKMSEEQKDTYYEAKDKHYEDNPGVYFRNNVWYWRPLWAFICDTCSNILTNKDMENGKLEISSDGLARITFNDSKYKTTYYLIQKQIN